MSSKDAHLYGIPRPKTTAKSKPITNSSSLSFSTALGSIISSSTRPASASATSSAHTLGRARPSRTKPDIFTTHNRNAHKRAAADMLASSREQVHTTNGAPLDNDSWRRAKRKMEDKARLYSAMKRGDIDDDDNRALVDFDRKWAEKGGADGELSEQEDSEDGSDSDGEVEMVDFEDEFGRTRRGTRLEAAREAARRKRATGEASDAFTARPVQPASLIYGDAIQAAAFEPDAITAERMTELAAKRDRELTPPEAVHFDSREEIRTRGTGFFAFSRDEEERVRQMAALEKEREETERIRAEREEKVKKRREEIEERRKKIKDKAGKIFADKFLDELGAELFGGKEATDTDGEHEPGIGND